MLEMTTKEEKLQEIMINYLLETANNTKSLVAEEVFPDFIKTSFYKDFHEICISSDLGDTKIHIGPAFVAYNGKVLSWYEEDVKSFLDVRNSVEDIIYGLEFESLYS